jgi:hypothetical protein
MEKVFKQLYHKILLLLNTSTQFFLLNFFVCFQTIFLELLHPLRQFCTCNRFNWPKFSCFRFVSSLFFFLLLFFVEYCSVSFSISFLIDKKKCRKHIEKEKKKLLNLWFKMQYQKNHVYVFNQFQPKPTNWSHL